MKFVNYYRRYVAFASYGLMSVSTEAQGTFRFGFEDVPVGTLPPYVQPSEFFVEPSVIEGALQPQWTAFEGQNTLLGWGEAFLSSPDGNLIQSFSLRMMVSDISPQQLSFGAGHVAGEHELAGTWQELRGDFAMPVTAIRLYSIRDQGQILPSFFLIDAVEFQTIPEPFTFALFGLAALAVLATRRWRVINSPAASAKEEGTHA